MTIFSLFTTASFTRRVVAWAGTALLASSMPAIAATQIDLWHSLSPHNKDVFEGLVSQFNRQSKDVRVRLKAFESSEAIDAELSRIEQDRKRPHLVQLDEARLPDVEAMRSYIQPLHVL